MKPIRLATVFSGIGAPEWAFKRLGIPYDSVLACDNGEILIDGVNSKEELAKIRQMPFSEAKQYVDLLYSSHTRKHNFVKDTYLANYPDFNESNYYLDVCLLDGLKLKDKVDLFIGGSPCQSFSTVGFQNGLNDSRGKLFYQFVRLVSEIRPKVFIYENVLGIRSAKNLENWDRMWKSMDGLGYVTWTGAMNAKDYGIPQVRNRLFVVGFKDRSVDISKFKPTKKELKLKMQDFLLTSTKFGGFTFKKGGDLVFTKDPGKVEERYFLSDAVRKYVLTPGTKTFKTQIKTDREIARTLLSTMGNHHRAGIDNYVTDGGRLRSLTERECLRLMGFTDDFKEVVSVPQIYKQAGNSMVVDVIMSLIKAILSFDGVFD